MVQLDYDKEDEPRSSMYGTMLAELEVQRMIRRAELWAFTMALAGLVGPSTVHTDSMGIVDGVCREEVGLGLEACESTPHREGEASHR